MLDIEGQNINRARQKINKARYNKIYKNIEVRDGKPRYLLKEI